MTMPGADRKNWVAPIEFGADPRFVFGGSNFVLRMNTEICQRAWLRISPDLTEGTVPRAPGFGTITALGTTDGRREPRLRRHRQRPDVGQPQRDGGDAADVTWHEAREPGLPGPLGHPHHRRPGQRQDRVGDLLGLALG